MAVDEVLLETAADERICCLRFYQWREPTLSLGFFQTFDDRTDHATSTSCPVVRRLSGGGAILHDRELTYSFVAPAEHRWAKARDRLYSIFHATLQDVLAAHHVGAHLVPQPNSANRPPTCQSAAEQPGDRNPATPPRSEPFLCFQRRSPGDLLVGMHKIAGSAQRRCRGAILQHGSVLLEQSPAAPELEGLGSLIPESEPLGRHWTQAVEVMRERWLGELAARLALSWIPSRLTEPQRERTERLAHDKYGSDNWTVHRQRS